jgi:hypothetical protein
MTRSSDSSRSPRWTRQSPHCLSREVSTQAPPGTRKSLQRDGVLPSVQNSSRPRGEASACSSCLGYGAVERRRPLRSRPGRADLLAHATVRAPGGREVAARCRGRDLAPPTTSTSTSPRTRSSSRFADWAIVGCLVRRIPRQHLVATPFARDRAAKSIDPEVES